MLALFIFYIVCLKARVTGVNTLSTYNPVEIFTYWPGNAALKVIRSVGRGYAAVVLLSSV